LGPVLELWQQLVSASPGVISRKVGRETGNKNQDNTSTNKSDPVEDFIIMECDIAGDNCAQVDASLSALKKVKIVST
jgi:hypothetical protein